MKILKSYVLELCFILSFALPFIKGVNADNGRRFVEIYYGFTFLMEHAIVTVVFLCSLLIACLLKKTVDEMASCWKLSIFDFVDCYRGLFLPHVARRFDTTLDKFGNPDTNLSVGLLSKHLVGNSVDNKVL